MIQRYNLNYMKNPRSSHHKKNPIVDDQVSISDSNQSLEPMQKNILISEWTILNQRIANIEVILTKMQKKINKFERVISNTNNIEKQLSEELFKIKINGYNSEQQHKQSSIKEQLLRVIHDEIANGLKNSITTLQLKNQQMMTKIKQPSHLTEDFQNMMQAKLQEHFLNNKKYIEQAIQEMNQIYQQHIKQPQQRFYRSGKKSVRPSQSKSQSNYILNSEQAQQKQENIPLMINKNQNSVHSQNDTNNRVNYLRQKLMQFEKINQKYEIAEKTNAKDSKTANKAVQRMLDYKNFLEQSQSQIQPSASFIPDKERQAYQPITDKWKTVENLMKNQYRKK